MSTLKCDSIKSADGNTDLLTLSNGAVTGVNLGRRNLIINGAMQVAQRGTSVSVSTSSNTYLLDRFFSRIQASSGSATVSQDSDSPNGFDKSLKFTVDTADATLGSSDYNRVQQSIEGYNILPLAWGTSDAKPATLSFWVKGSVTGTYSVGIYNGAANKSFVSEYTIDSANTWEYKTIAISAITSGTWTIDNSAELNLSFPLGSGTTYSTSTLDTWLSEFKFSSTNTTNLMATAGATWQITGVQLEVGSVATPFEHRSYGEELALCQRYYQVQDFRTCGWVFSTTQASCGYSFPTMRTAPSFSLSSGAIQYGPGGQQGISASYDLPAVNAVGFIATCGGSLTVNASTRVFGVTLADAEL